MMGEGKYDDVCGRVMTDTDADGVLLIIINGVRGQGFSMKTTDRTLEQKLPALLRFVADQIEYDIKHRN
jgi:hypothetical protein